VAIVAQKERANCILMPELMYYANHFVISHQNQCETGVSYRFNIKMTNPFGMKMTNPFGMKMTNPFSSNSA
jgi:hypothetical protein